MHLAGCLPCEILDCRLLPSCGIAISSAASVITEPGEERPGQATPAIKCFDQEVAHPTCVQKAFISHEALPSYVGDREVEADCVNGKRTNQIFLS